MPLVLGIVARGSPACRRRGTRRRGRRCRPGCACGRSRRAASVRRPESRPGWRRVAAPVVVRQQPAGRGWRGARRAGNGAALPGPERARCERAALLGTAAHEAALHRHAPEDLASRPSGGGTVTHVLKPMCHPCPGARHVGRVPLGGGVRARHRAGQCSRIMPSAGRWPVVLCSCRGLRPGRSWRPRTGNGGR